MESLIVSIVILLCALIFIGVGIFAWKKETPMNFWSGTEVKAEEISDIRAYNKENGIMWITYGLTFITASILSLIFRNAVGVMLVVLLCTIGTFILVIAYRRIYLKYKI